MSKGPEIGAALSTEDMDMILEAIKERNDKHPDEPGALTLYLILTGIGERFRKIQCVEQEFECLKFEVPESLTCPNGHSLHEGPGVTLGWVEVAAEE